MIMLMMSNIIATNSTRMNWPASVSIRNGVMIGDTSVEQAVMVTESGTFPPAR